MESLSMRKRQTVFGAQIPQPGSSSKAAGPGSGAKMPAAPQHSNNTLLPPPPRVGAQIRRFSRLNSMKPLASNNSNYNEESAEVASMRSASSALEQLDPALTAPDFDADTYLEQAAQHADAEFVVQFADMLRAQLQKLADAETQTVQTNQRALVTLATSVGKISGVVSDLHREVAELSMVTDAMLQDACARHADINGGLNQSQYDKMPLNGINNPINSQQTQPANEPLDSTTNRRQSVLALNSLWAHDLQSLYQRVDGVQKLIPPAPGRHVALEEHGWLELNLVTQQSVKPVLLVLLNDYLLIAASRHGKYAVDEHWRLDAKPTFDIDETNKVLTVCTGTHTRGLLAPSLARLRAVYNEICKLAEISASQGSLNPGRGGASRLGHTHNSSNNLNTITNSSNANSGIGSTHRLSQLKPLDSVDVSPELKRECARVLAEMDSLIAYRSWNDAVQLYIQNKSTPAFSEPLNTRAEQLVSLLLSELQSLRPRSKQESIQLLNLLKQMDRGREARHALLDSAARDIDIQQRSVHFLGDVVNYISQMAAIYFQSIIATVEIYRSAFPAEEDSSLVVTWAKTQVDVYAGVFNRQLFRIAPELKGYQKCREVSRLESLQMKSLRMEMEFMLRYVWEQ